MEKRAMIEVRTLRVPDIDAALSLIQETGYTSSARYDVRKVETREQTAITLQLVALEQPYAKKWSLLEDDIARYQRVVEQKWSLGAYDADRIVGVAIAERQDWNRSLWVWEFCVAGTHQRTGIGRRLMDTLAERAKNAGLRVIACETQNTNVPAITFYRRVGFELDGIDLSYYSNSDVTDGEVAIFMKRKL
jgi:ribosomal protein S18 acetylase RimI-like enzyme